MASTHPRTLVASVLLALVATLQGQHVPAHPTSRVTVAEHYVVLYAEGTDRTAGRHAVEAAGGEVVSDDADTGIAAVTSHQPAFAEQARRDRALAGVVRDRVVGRSPGLNRARPSAAGASARPPQQRPAPPSAPQTASRTAATAGDPFEPQQWGMRALRTAEARARHTVDRRVLVAIIDTGVDGSHPDLAPVLDRERSRNFTTDIPTDPGGSELDGPCEVAGCVDPVDRDDEGHGTHVASLVAAPVNGRGIAGVAPGVRIVNLRAGQDSGYFFLQPTLDALTYAGRIGVDVATLSFYTDPWLFNCTDNPADSPAEQQEQRTVIEATQRAVDFARKRGVTLLAAAGNDGLDLGAPGVDRSSPDYPQPTAARDDTRTRVLDNASCLSMPSEARGVLAVTATGPSGRKASYSSFGVERAVVAAPGGDVLDESRPAPGNQVLGAFPRAVLRAQALIAADGRPLDDTVVRDCRPSGCAYYRWMAGTSMAAPHAAGVAALIVSRRGGRDPADRGGWTLRPSTVERLLRSSAVDRACPPGGVQTYSDGSRHRCEGTSASNGFFGDGVVDALRAVS